MKILSARVTLKEGVPIHNNKEVVLHERVLAQLVHEGDTIDISPLAIKYKNT